MNNRIKSFLWRLGAYIVVSAISYTVANLADLGVNEQLVTIIALIAGEITKWINTQYQLEAKVGRALKRR